MKKLTVGLFLEHYDPFVSGVITSVKSIRQELERKGHAVYIVCPAVKRYSDKDSHIIRIPSFPTKALENTTVGVPGPAAVKRLMGIKFDIIHSQEVVLVSTLGLYIARRQNIPYIQTYHTLWDRFFEQYKLSPRVYAVGTATALVSYPFLFGLKATRGLLAKMFDFNHQQKWSARSMWQHMLTMGEQADLVVVPSNHLKKHLLKDGLSRPVLRITNGYSAFKPLSGELLPQKTPGMLRVISVARLSTEKRLDTLLEACSRQKNVELVLVGEGSDRDRLEDLASKKHLADRVRFMGQLSNQAVRQLMRECDVLAQASYNFDNQPMVIIEALDAGLPIIYCDPKLTEGLTAGNSILVAKTAAGFTNGFGRLSDAKLRRKMAAASTRLAKNYSSKVTVAELLTVYNRAISQRR